MSDGRVPPRRAPKLGDGWLSGTLTLENGATIGEGYYSNTDISQDESVTIEDGGAVSAEPLPDPTPAPRQ